MATVVKLGAGLLVVKLLAVSFGPEGVGRAGNFMTFVTVVGVLSGAGVYNGVTKYVAQFQSEGDDLRLRRMLGTSGSIVLGVSGLLAVLLWILADLVSRLLFGGDGLAEVIRAMAFVQFGLAYTNLFQAILKGHRDARGTALSVVFGSVLGLLGYGVCFGLGGYVGALVGLAVVPALAVLPSWIILRRNDPLALRWLRPLWDGESARLLAKFTAMVVITALMLPTAYVMMRNVLAEHSSWAQVGIWQGMSKISDSYLQFITASFSVYLLPTFSRLRDKRQIARETGRVLRFVMGTVAAASVGVWLLRDLIVSILYSPEFASMRELFAWQLTGDVFKVGGYIFGYLVIAKAALRLYLLAEVSQLLLLVGFAYLLVPTHGAVGASQAYLATYIVYFCLCVAVFLCYQARTAVGSHTP